MTGNHNKYKGLGFVVPCLEFKIVCRAEVLICSDGSTGEEVEETKSLLITRSQFFVCTDEEEKSCHGDKERDPKETYGDDAERADGCKVLRRRGMYKLRTTKRQENALIQ